MSNARKKNNPKTSLDILKTEEIQRILFDEAAYGMFITDSNGRYIAVNKQAINLCGYSLRELLKMTITDLLLPEDLAADPLHHEELLKGKIVMNERRIRRKDGAIINLELSVRMLPEGNLLGIVRDITEYKRSEITYREIFSKVNDTIWIHDLDTYKIIDVNNNVTEMFGYPIKDALNLSLNDISSGIPPYIQETALELLKKAAAGEPQLFDWHSKHKDGHFFWTEVSLKRANIAGKECVLSIERDIAGRKRVDEALKTSAEEYQIITNTSMDGFCVIDKEGHLTDTNEAFCHMIGYKRNELLNMSIQDLVITETADETKIHIQKIIRTGSDIFESKLKHKEGENIGVEVSVTFSPQSFKLMVFLRNITERKRAEEALRESEERYRRQVEKSPVGFYQINISQGRIRQVNDVIPAYTGYTHEELMEMSPLDLLTPESRERFLERLKKVLNNEPVPPNVEYQIRIKNGEVRWAELETSFFLEGNDRIANVVIRDISERKMTEEALKTNRKQLIDIIEFLPDATLVIDKERRIIIWNKAIEKMTGIPATEMVGQGGFAYTIPFYGERRKSLMDLVFEDSKETEAKYPFITREGDTILAEVFCNALYNNKGAWVFATASPLHDQSGNIIGAIESIRDITERKQAVESIRESEALYRTIFNNTGTGMIIVSEDTTMTLVNDSFIQMTGYERCELEGIRSWTDFVVKEDLERMRKYHTLRREDPGLVPMEYEFRFTDKQGEIHHCILNVAMIPGTTNSVASILDITGHKKAEQEKEKLHAQLMQAQKMESVGILAGGVAHDFNNLLTAILGHTDLALMRCAKSDPVYSDLTAINTSARRSADLVRQLLAFARKQIVAPKVLDLNDTIAGIIKMLNRLIGEEITFSWMPGKKLWAVKIDPSQVDQLLANLCINARDAIAGIGKITIETKNTEFDEDYCKDHPGLACGEFVMLSVSDDGSGMDKDVLNHLFEPFFTTKELGKGTGLGLATVYGIVKQNNGYINVYSEPGKGSTFTIYLPRYAGEAIEMKAESKTEIPDAKGKTVLLVDDAAVILTVSRGMLERIGCSVLAAGSPSDALQQAKAYSGKIDLLITDVVMPEMNGRELAEKLVKIIPELKCLYTSGYTSDVIAHHGVLDKDVDFLQKPYTVKDLALKIHEILNRK